MNTYFLYLNTHRLSAYRWQSGSLLPESIFENDNDGLELFAQFLAVHPDGRYALLVNVAEEGHAQETIPFLRGADRSTLIARKISQQFLGSPLAIANTLGYEKNQRKNEKLLLSALTNPAHLDPWLQRLMHAEVALSGIYTVSQLGGQLLKKLGLPKERCLLLSMQDHSIRSSYLANGQTLFSRMSPLTDSSIAGIASAFATESAKLQQYLIGQRLIGREETLPAFIMAHPLMLSAVEKACPDRAQLNFSLIDSHTAAHKLGLTTLPEDNRSDLLFMHLLAIAAPRQQFANDQHRHHFHLFQLRRGLIAAGVVVLLGSALFSAKQAYETHTFREETQALRASDGELNRRYQAIAGTLPQLSVDNDTLRQLTDRYAELSRLQRQPGEALGLVGQVLERFPAIVLDSIEWQNQPPYASGQNVASRETTIVRGTVDLQSAEARKVLSMFDDFVAALRKQSGWSINVLQQPFDVASGSALRGGDGIDEAAKPRQFSVEIIRNYRP